MRRQAPAATYGLPLVNMDIEVTITKPEELEQTMTCPKCSNPVSLYSNYKCRKCKTQLIFKLNHGESRKK